MNKHFLRLVAIVLTACLLVDPAAAAALSSPSSPRFTSLPRSLADQALTLSLVLPLNAFSGPPAYSIRQTAASLRRTLTDKVDDPLWATSLTSTPVWIWITFGLLVLAVYVLWSVLYKSEALPLARALGSPEREPRAMTAEDRVLQKWELRSARLIRTHEELQQLQRHNVDLIVQELSITKTVVWYGPHYSYTVKEMWKPFTQEYLRHIYETLPPDGAFIHISFNEEDLNQTLARVTKLNLPYESHALRPAEPGGAVVFIKRPTVAAPLVRTFVPINPSVVPRGGVVLKFEKPTRGQHEIGKLGFRGDQAKKMASDLQKAQEEEVKKGDSGKPFMREISHDELKKVSAYISDLAGLNEEGMQEAWGKKHEAVYELFQQLPFLRAYIHDLKVLAANPGRIVLIKGEKYAFKVIRVPPERPFEQDGVRVHSFHTEDPPGPDGLRKITLYVHNDLAGFIHEALEFLILPQSDIPEDYHHLLAFAAEVIAGGSKLYVNRVMDSAAVPSRVSSELRESPRSRLDILREDTLNIIKHNNEKYEKNDDISTALRDYSRRVAWAVHQIAEGLLGVTAPVPPLLGQPRNYPGDKLPTAEARVIDPMDHDQSELLPLDLVRKARQYDWIRIEGGYLHWNGRIRLRRILSGKQFPIPLHESILFTMRSIPYRIIETKGKVLVQEFDGKLNQWVRRGQLRVGFGISPGDLKVNFKLVYKVEDAGLYVVVSNHSGEDVDVQFNKSPEPSTAPQEKTPLDVRLGAASTLPNEEKQAKLLWLTQYPNSLVPIYDRQRPVIKPVRKEIVTSRLDLFDLEDDKFYWHTWTRVESIDGERQKEFNFTEEFLFEVKGYLYGIKPVEKGKDRRPLLSRYDRVTKKPLIGAPADPLDPKMKFSIGRDQVRASYGDALGERLRPVEIEGYIYHEPDGSYRLRLINLGDALVEVEYKLPPPTGEGGEVWVERNGFLVLPLAKMALPVGSLASLVALAPMVPMILLGIVHLAEGLKHWRLFFPLNPRLVPRRAVLGSA